MPKVTSSSTDQILADIKAKKMSPVYFLQGEEPYFIDLIANLLEESAIPESDKGFNQTIFYGKDVDLGTIIGAAKRFPMMAERQLVMIKEAQEIKDLNKYQKIKVEGKELEINPLEEYLKKPLPSTILVFCHKYKNVDGKKGLSKALEQNSIFFQSELVRDYKLVEWIKNFCGQKKIKITDSAIHLLAEYIGTNLARISNELDKIFISEPKDTLLEDKHINKYIGENKEYSAFEFSKAISKKDILKTNKILNYFAENEKDHPIQPIISTLFGFFSKVFVARSLGVVSINDAQAKMSMSYPQAIDCIEALKNFNDAKLFQIISLLREADMKSKGFDGNNYDNGAVLRDLTIRIFY